MMAVKEFHYVETAAVYIEVDVSFLEIRCNGFPYPNFRMHSLDYGISSFLSIISSKFDIPKNPVSQMGLHPQCILDYSGQPSHKANWTG